MRDERERGRERVRNEGEGVIREGGRNRGERRGGEELRGDDEKRDKKE